MDKGDTAAAGPTGTANGAEKATEAFEQVVSAALPFLSDPDKAGALSSHNAQVIQFITIDNRGTIDNRNGSMTGVMTNSDNAEIAVNKAADPEGAPGATDAAVGPAQDENIDVWFEGLEGGAKCLAIAIAFLPNATLTAVLQARDRLVALLLPKEDKAKERGFGKSRTALLREVRAIVDGDAGEEQEGPERVRFLDGEFADELRRYILKERTDIRVELLQWMIDQPGRGDAQSALSLGMGIGLSAPVAFTSLFDDVVLPLATRGPELHLLAAGEAMGVAVQTAPRSKDRIVRQLHEWTSAGSPTDAQIRAVRLCASSWGVAELEAALIVLYRAEADDPLHLFPPVQQAIDLYWALSSLVTDASDRIIAGLAKGLERWNKEDRRSILCILPMAHIASAIHSEIGYLKAERPLEPPLLLRAAFQTTSAFQAAAGWLERGLLDRHTRKFVQAVLGQLLNRARELGVRDAFIVLVEAMISAAANLDGRKRIRFICESWKIPVQPEPLEG